MTEPRQTIIRLVQTPVPAEGMTMVVLLPVNPLGIKPDHCVHGQASCWVCGQMCYLGSESEKKVAAGVWAPICRPCAMVTIPRGSKPTGNANDHKRADGPHAG